MRFLSPMKTIILLSSVFLILSSSLVCASTKVVLQLPWQHQFQFAGYYMAKELGYYQDAGLDVDILDVQQGQNTVTAVVTGQADFGISGSGLIVERSLGKPVVAVATIFQRTPTIFLTLQESSIKAPTDFIGKKVMLSPGYQSLSLIALLHQEKVLDKVIRLKTSYDYNSLLAGETDVFNAYSTNEPYLLESNGNKINIINPEDYGIYFYGDTLFTSEENLQLNPAEVEEFRLASLRGWKYALGHFDETIKVIQQQYKVSKTTDQLRFEAERVKEVVKSDQITIGNMDRANWAQITHHLIAIGAVPADFHIKDVFIYEPPESIDWSQLGPWIGGIIFTFTTLLIFLSVLSRSNMKLRTTKKQLRKEISDRENMENQLRKSEEKHRSLFERAPFPYHALDVNGCFIDVNFEWLQILGYQRNEVIGNWYGDFLAEDSQQMFSESFPLLKSTGFANNVPFRIRHKDGHFLDILLEGRGGYAPDGQFVQTYCIFHDISEKKRAEQEIKESENKFRVFADNTYDWEYWLDPAGEYVYISPSCERITGYTLKEFRANPELLVEITNQEFKLELQNHLTDSRVDGFKPCQQVFSITTKAGDIRWIEHNCLPIYDDDGRSIGRRGCNRDITIRKNAEDLRIELESQLRQKFKMEAVGVMAGGMAHNFNNNLSIILGNLELSQLKLTSKGEIYTYLDHAKIAVLRARDLIKQIMTYSRKGLQQMSPVQLSTIIDETIILLGSTIPTSVSLKQEIASDCVDLSILAEASQVQEILLNLYNNAVHAMDERGTLSLKLQQVRLQEEDIAVNYSCEPGLYLCLSVRDDGSGMAAEVQEKIFDPFFTTKDLYEGTGMGLSTVQGIMEQYHGMIKVESVVGEGTAFYLYFPVAGQFTATVSSELSATGIETWHGNENILFVDDDAVLAELGKEILTSVGYRVTSMTNSEEAVDYFAANAEKYDLVVSDQTMPQLSGKELMEKIKQVRPEIRTIICTGFSSKIDANEAKKMGIDAFLLKPLALPVLLKTVRQVLDGNNT